MATRSQTLDEARRWIGYSRYNDPEEGTIFGRWFAEQVNNLAFARNGVPYCDMFVSKVANAVRLLVPGGLSAWVPGRLAAARREHRVISLAAAREGDLLVFDWNGDGIADHIGFLEKKLANGLLQTIEGNTSPGTAGSQSNGGGVYRRYRNPAKVIAVIAPYYDDAPAPARPVKPARLVEDGIGGPATIDAAQYVYGTPRDGKITGQWQPNAGAFPALAAVSFSPKGEGSTLVRKMQYWIGVPQDGLLGPATVKALQQALKVPADGILGPQTMRAFQHWLNGKMGY